MKEMSTDYFSVLIFPLPFRPSPILFSVHPFFSFSNPFFSRAFILLSFPSYSFCLPVLCLLAYVAIDALPRVGQGGCRILDDACFQLFLPCSEPG